MLIPFSVESLIAFAVVVLAALPLHEYGHAWMAVRLGDRTPYYQGRLTLDPRAHLDLVGTLLLAVAGFGWAKPVQFVPSNLRDAPSFKVGIVLVALAGPLMNVVIAIVAALLLRIDIGNRTVDGILGTIVFINLLLAVFNMIPLVPLDGSKVLWGLMPDSWSRAYEQIQQYSLLILLVMIVPLGGASLLSRIISPIVVTLGQALIGF